MRKRALFPQQRIATMHCTLNSLINIKSALENNIYPTNILIYLIYLNINLRNINMLPFAALDAILWQLLSTFPFLRKEPSDASV